MVFIFYEFGNGRYVKWQDIFITGSRVLLWTTLYTSLNTILKAIKSDIPEMGPWNGVLSMYLFRDEKIDHL